jgi:alpha-glucosidase
MTDGGEPWWKRAVVYQIYPRSFADSNGDGVGDLEGVRRRLDYLSWLGIDAIWLSPFYPSPMRDGGYDVSDSCGVDPSFGTLEDFDWLLADAHRRGLRVLLDWVPNHTSDRHPWFVESRSSRRSPKRDWYLWRDEPNNWRAALGAGSAWTFDEATGQYYLHLFLPEQPGLNWRNPAVVEAMHGVLRFWLDRGADGFRIDVAHCIGKDPEFRDEPRCLAGEPLSDFNDQPYSHEVLRGIRHLVDGYPGERVTVGEVNIRSTAQVARYYGAGDELHMSFNFPPLDAPWDAIVFASVINEVTTHLGDIATWPTWVLSNHDNERHRTRYGGSLRRCRAAAVLLLTLRGTPFLFQGEEPGLENVALELDEQIDPGGRDGARGPIPWEAEASHGWPEARTLLPFPPDAGRLSAAAQRRDPASILHLYRRVIALRRASPALALGSFEELPAPAGTIGYRRRLGGEARSVLVNFTADPQQVDVPGDWTVELASAGEAGGPYEGEVPEGCAVILKPRRSAATSR